MTANNKIFNQFLGLFILISRCAAFLFLKSSGARHNFHATGIISSTNNDNFPAVKMGDTFKQEWDVDLYQNQHNFVWEYGSSLIDLLDPQASERILDVGCGTGVLTQEISSQAGGTVVAIGFDADLSMVQKAQEQFPNLTFFQASAEETIELDGGPVDAIFSNAALHWVTDAESAVASMSRNLKPGGRFVVEFGGKGNVQQIVDATIHALEEKYNTTTIKNPWYFPSIAEYSSLLEKYGIEVTFARLFDRPTPLEAGENGLSNWLRMFGKNSFFKDVPEQHLEILLDQISENLRPRLFDGKQWRADYRRIQIVGVKKKK